jgi:hypothetical protein
LVHDARGQVTRMTYVAGANSATALAAGSGQGSDWIASTMTAIKNSTSQGGILGALASSGGDQGSISSFLQQSSAASNNLTLISQGNLSSTSAFYAQIASSNEQARQQDALQKALAALSQSQGQVQAKNVLDPFIYLADGTSIDTENNILTRPDGSQYDITTGAKYVDPASVMQLANGAYLDTKNNILTMSNGTKIDTVTGLKVSTNA